jgi:hypothetical protein
VQRSRDAYPRRVIGTGRAPVRAELGAGTKVRVLSRVQRSRDAYPRRVIGTGRRPVSTGRVNHACPDPERRFASHTKRGRWAKLTRRTVVARRCLWSARSGSHGRIAEQSTPTRQRSARRRQRLVKLDSYAVPSSTIALTHKLDYFSVNQQEAVWSASSWLTNRWKCACHPTLSR